MKKSIFAMSRICITAICVLAIAWLLTGCGSIGVGLESSQATTPAPTATPPPITPIPTPAPTPAAANTDGSSRPGGPDHTTNQLPEHTPDCDCWAIEFNLALTDTPTHAAYRWVVPTVFDRVGPATGSHMWVNYCCRFGVINQAGEFVIPFIYEGFVSPDFNMMLDIYYPTVFASGQYADMSSGYIAAQVGGMWGVIDITNRVVVPFIYAYIEIYHDYGVATVSDGERWAAERRSTGLIELATGREVVPLGRYHTIYGVRGGYAIAFTTINPATTTPRQEGLICIATGREVIPLRYEQVWMTPEYERLRPPPGQFRIFRDGGNDGIMGAGGNIVLPAIYERVDLHNMPSGLAIVLERCPDVPHALIGGIVDLHTGEMILPIQYYFLRALGEGRAIALSSDSLHLEHFDSAPTTWILIDISTGQEIGEITYAFETGHISNFHGGVAIISVGNAWGDTWRNGVIDNMGREVIPPVNASIRHFSEYLLAVDYRDERTLTMRGRIVCKDTLEEILPWHDYVGQVKSGLAVINTGGEWIPWGEWMNQIVGGQWGIIDNTGQVVNPTVLDFTRVALAQGNANIVAVERDGKWGVIAIG